MADDYRLSPSSVMDLRLWAKSGYGIRDGEPDRGAPFITFGPSLPQTYYLHSGGITIAASADPLVICYLLRNERLERGYTARLLAATNDAAEALLPPEERERRRIERYNAEARAKRLQDDAQAAADRYRAQRHGPKAEEITLDDLLAP